jgi:uncharacterized protein (DUF1697 family)
MQSYVVLLRAVNLTGTGKIAMSDLKALCVAAGCDSFGTYIASGNVVLKSARTEPDLRAEIGRRVEALMGKPVGIITRTPAELARGIAANPFSGTDPARTHICFFDQPPPADALERIRHRLDEEVVLGERELFLHYPNGQGQSRMVVPAMSVGTARNLNTARKLLELVEALT